MCCQTNNEFSVFLHPRTRVFVCEEIFLEDRYPSVLRVGDGTLLLVNLLHFL